MQKDYFIPGAERINSITGAISTIESLSAHGHYLKLLLSETGTAGEDASDIFFDPEDDDLLEETKQTLSGLRELWMYEVQKMKGAIKRAAPDSKDEFIKTYLKPGKKLPIQDLYPFVKVYIYDRVDVPSGIPEYIQEMEYKNFLTTPYWAGVTYAARAEHPTCQLCGSDKKLEVHHPVYNFHGNEVKHVNALTVLCHDCHSKFHATNE